MLQFTWIISQQQGYKPVSTYQVVGSKDNNEVDSNHDQNSYDFVPFMGGEGWRLPECHPNVG